MQDGACMSADLRGQQDRPRPASSVDVLHCFASRGPLCLARSRRGGGLGEMAGTPRNAKGEFLSPEEQHTFFGSFNHADERFPNLKGARRWKAILRVYGKSTNATLKVLKFDSETSKYQRLWVRSKFNNRRQDQVVRQYAKSILSGGAVEHCRGQLIAVEVEGQEGGDCPTYEMLGGASLCEAIEVAAEMHSSNEFVQDVAESGLSNVIVLMAGMPPDVQRWIKTEHNNDHSGPDTNIVEMYRYVEAAGEGWKNHKKGRGHHRGQLPQDRRLPIREVVRAVCSATLSVLQTVATVACHVCVVFVVVGGPWCLDCLLVFVCLSLSLLASLLVCTCIDLFAIVGSFVCPAVCPPLPASLSAPLSVSFTLAEHAPPPSTECCALACERTIEHPVALLHVR